MSGTGTSGTGTSGTGVSGTGTSGTGTSGTGMNGTGTAGTGTAGTRPIPPGADAWLADDPDEGDRAELSRLIEAARAGDAAAAAGLADRFSDRLHFGTAGLRGEIGAGPNRINRAVVRATTAALARYLLETVPGSAEAGVAVCCDARHRSPELADEATAVLAGAGFVVHRLGDRQPTPLLAFAVAHLGAAAGVMVTASHNPPRDNGYKLYLGDGAQIVPPVDAEIESLIGEVGPLRRVPLGPLDGPRVVHHGVELSEAYLRALAAISPFRRPEGPQLRVVYTPLHGVALPLFRAAMARCGYAPPAVVTEQAQPDPDFSTVPFPNPEEPGALDLAFAAARAGAADLVLANDPDGDRLAVGVPDPAADGWRRLTGDEVGCLLGDFVLGQVPRESALVASSVVSSGMLGRIAEAAGVPFVATLTGFKWIVRAPESVPGRRLAFGYEEALGYAVGDVVRDKDGVGAAIAFLGLATALAAGGSSVLERLDELAARFGVHLTRQLTLLSRTPAEVMAHLRASPPRNLDDDDVASVVDFSAGDAVWQPGLPPLPAADVLAYRLASGAKVLVRPSGTEPKLKAYLEVVDTGTAGGVALARERAAGRLARLEASVSALIGAH